jgi:hypothetical protein
LHDPRLRAARLLLQTGADRRAACNGPQILDHRIR